MVRVCKSSIIFLCIHPSVHPSYVHLSITLSPPKPPGGIQPNLLHPFPSWLGCARAAVFFCVSIHPCICHPSICLSCYLLNLWAEFNQTCYITSSQGCVRAIFFPCLHRPSICPSCNLLPNHWVEFNQTCYITSPHVRVCESNIFFPCVHRLSICLLRCLLLNHWAEFNKLATSLPLMIRVCKSNIIFLLIRLASVHLSITLSPPKPLGRI